MTEATSTNRSSDVLIVGGGLDGLSAAAHAAPTGASITVLEKARELGRRGSTQNRDGFLLNQGRHALDPRSETSFHRRVDYRNKVVIVTGASSGIGLVTARAFAARGATVMCVARRETLLKKLVKECRDSSPETTYLCGDLGERAFAERVVDKTVERFGRVDVLVNNAAVSKHKEIYHSSIEEAEWVMRVNYLSPVWLSFTAIPYMLRAGGGTIVNVSSMGGRIPPPREALYAASKSALSAFSEGALADLEGSGIHVALVLPGAIDTEIWDKEDEPVGFIGKKYPPELVTDAILDAIENRRAEVIVPRFAPGLLAARFLQTFFPSFLRRAVARTHPSQPDVIARARARAENGKRLGDLSEG
ncbi:MAG: NAD(P)-dependent oxidoreductase [Candidatus Binatia bacterium]|nr:NAD(P)-dependent oxidoreductase [Candidatus Binatia bacterium]